MSYFKTVEFNGKKIAYTRDTEFLVQVGKGSKGSYKTSYRFVGDLSRAVFHYSCINIHSGYKKRIFVPSFNKPVLTRAFS